MTAWVQVEKPGEWPTPNHEVLWKGFEQRGHEVSALPFSQIESQLPIGLDVYYGGIEWVKKVMCKLGYRYNPLGHVPSALMPFAKRRIETIAFKEAAARVVAGETLHLKPVPENNKRFAGMLVRKQMDLLTMAHCPHDDMVIASAPIPIISEYRCYVLNRSVLDARRYRGSHRHAPDWGIVDSVVDRWQGQPIAYVMDFAVTESGETALIEVNDCLSMGAYGVPSADLAAMVEARWEEVHRNKGWETN